MIRSHRSTAGQRAGVSVAALEQLKAARSSIGASRVSQVRLRDEGEVYSELSEAEYRQLVQERRLHGDFVEDDGEDLGYQDDGEENWADYVGEEDDGRDGGQQHSKVSRVARVPSHRRKAAPVVPSAPVSGAFLGGGRSVGPGSSSSAGMTADDERLMAALVTDLERDPLKGDDGDDDGMDDDESGAVRELGDIAMFAQPDALTDTLQAVYERDDRLRQETVRAQRRAVAVHRRVSSSAAARPFDVLPPQPITDIDDVATSSALDVECSPPSPSTSSLAPGGVQSGEGPVAADPQHLANVAALSEQPAAKRKREAGGFAFSATRAVDSGSRSAAASGLLPTAPAPCGLPSAADVFSSALQQQGASTVPQPAAAPTASGTHSCTSTIAASLPKDSTASPLSADSSLLFYYYDAYEEAGGRAGTVYLFGKSLIPQLTCSASTCLQVDGVQRNVYLLPRQFALLNADDESSVTDSKVSMKDVYDELRVIMHDHGVQHFKVKAVKRSYCFDRDVPLPGQAASLLEPDDGVPVETSYLKLVYPFSDRSLPRSLKGRTFSRVFGTKSTAMELLLLKRELMGPGWLRVSNIERVERVLSWCRFEYRVSSHKSIAHCLDGPQDAPLFSMLSLSHRTVRSDKSGKDELVLISMLHHAAVSVDSGAIVSDVSVESVLVAPNGLQLPGDWPLAVKEHNRKRANRQLVQCANERAMLGLVLTRIGQLDPDIILAHDLHQSTLDTVMARCTALKVPPWSKLGRLRKYKLPTLGSSESGGAAHHNASVVDKGVGCGRLLVDTQLMAKEFLLGQRMYTLSFLASTQLHMADRDEIDAAAVPSLFARSADLLRLAALTEADSFLCLKLCCHLQLLPLTKQLTTLSGNCWSRTLRSVRSERVEWLLLHDFHALKYIVPEKYTAQEKKDRHSSRAPQQQHRHPDKAAPIVLDGEGDGEAVQGDGDCGGGAGQKRQAGSDRRGRGKQSKGKAAAGASSTASSSRRRGKPLYSGGLVLEPKRGFYDKYVLLLDFNSLYPSIIQEFNICFTTIPHWRAAQTISDDTATRPAAADAMEDDDTDAADGLALLPAAPGSVPLPAASAPHGQLPRVIARLVERRREVKKLLKKEQDASRRSQLDIRQKALKLVANSMYGCLGFVNSRFYCAPLAALITAQGRDILSSSVELCATIGADVIYGDTDSLMIDTATSSLDAALQLGAAIKREINKKHSVLEIDVDAVYKNMLLLRKKKYAALKLVDDGKGGRTELREVKGLDLVRRDWCMLSKDIGNVVLNLLLSGRQRDDIVSAVLSCLDELQAAVHGHTVHLDQFVITKSLTRGPTDYADAHNQPHVQVALQMLARGDKVRSGDIVPYVVCCGEGSVARRCYHPSTVVAASGALTVDVQWYLSNQVLPPVVRLCGVMDELDSTRIAHALGLDPRHYRHQDERHTGGGGGGADRDEEEEVVALSSVCVDQEQRFRDCQPLLVSCPHCHKRAAFPGALVWQPTTEANGGSSDKPAAVLSGFLCATAGCNGLLRDSDDEVSFGVLLQSMAAAVRLHVRSALLRFYSASAVCNDSGCRHETRDMSGLHRDRCLRDRCHGRPVPTSAANSLYLELQHLLYLFDVQQQSDKISREDKRRQEEREAQAAAAAAAASAGTDGAATSTSLPSSLSAPWSASVSPSDVLSRRAVGLCQSLHAVVKRLLAHSKYHFVSPDVFDIAAGSASGNRPSS